MRARSRPHGYRKERGERMPAKNEDLHGMVPDKADVALVLLDVINDLEFEGGEELAKSAGPMAERIADLKRRAKAAGVPVVYVNDNYGRWQSDFHKLIEHTREAECRGRFLAEMLAPDEDDYFVLKPKHSGFYSTNLDILLHYLEARTLIITGLAGNICVLFTANDAFMRDFHLVVPSDCVASNSPEDNEHALRQMEKFLHADITPSTELDLQALVRCSGELQGNTASSRSS